MIINWYGGGCYKMQASGVSIVTDPDSSGSGNRLKGDLVIKTEAPVFADINNVVENEISTPGEFEISGTKIRGTAIPAGKGIIKTAYRVEVDDMAFGFLGNVSAELSEKALEALGEIDILFVPSNDIANKLVKSVDPKIVIPGWGDPKKVMADIGQKPDPQEKLVIKKKDLEEIEGLRLIVLKN
ncbi:MAG: MBL fold metallo-hydrolase [Candidatus Colwellbacteria bacterium]|nr:MBL fold metallo-hydrolase [Candidatus Colwellbacteria bacterium]MDD4818609.1 MBL fold metallo-hydrolase [Candidatus Colwellbacteria bacterium]